MYLNILKDINLLKIINTVVFNNFHDILTNSHLMFFLCLQ